MIDITPIRLAMRQRLLTAQSSQVGLSMNQIPAAWDNQPFTPPNPPSLWIREAWMQASERKVATGLLRLNGIWQYDVFDAVGLGTKKVDALSLAIGNVFPPSSAIPLPNGYQIAIIRSERKEGSEGRSRSGGDQVWYGVPVRVTIEAYAFITD